MIGKILKTMRKINGLKQSDISKITNIPQNTLSQYENEKIQPTFEIIEKVANVCGYEVMFKNKTDNSILTSKNIDRKGIE